MKRTGKDILRAVLRAPRRLVIVAGVTAGVLAVTISPALAATQPGSSGAWHGNSGGYCITTPDGTCYPLYQTYNQGNVLSSTTSGHPTNFYVWKGGYVRQAGTDLCVTYTGPLNGLGGYARLLTCDTAKLSQTWYFPGDGSWGSGYVTGPDYALTQNGPGYAMTTQGYVAGVYQLFDWE